MGLTEDPTPGAYSLAFPALGTSKDFGFPAEKAAPIVVGVVKEFLKKNPKVRTTHHYPSPHANSR